MTTELFGSVEFEDIKAYNRQRTRVEVPTAVLAELKTAQEKGRYAYWAVKDPAQFKAMENVLRSGGDLLEDASVLVKPVIREDGQFHVVSDVNSATHIRATVAKRRGFRPVKSSAE
jgi:hypothetical protein